MTAFARPNTVAFTSSKGKLTKALAVEWADKGIRVNAICPGCVDTEMARPLKEDFKFNQWVTSRCPMRRWGQPQEIAWPILFLASQEAAYITGQVLYVDGGWSAAL